MFNKKKMSYFGFRLVGKDEKILMVNKVFHSVAKKYDLMNDLMSFGMHRMWKSFLVENSGVQFGHRVLDLAGGTGDIAMKFSYLVGRSGIVVLVDINDSMINVARRRLRNFGIVGNVYYIQADAEHLPFLDNVFDCISIAFGLRNVAEKEKVLLSMYRVLKPGGRLLILDFSKPIYNFINKFYDLYSFCVLPYLGKMVVQDYYSYKYLVESIRMHPDQEQLSCMIYEAGFKNVEYFNMSCGISVLHRCYK